MNEEPEIVEVVAGETPETGQTDTQPIPEETVETAAEVAPVKEWSDDDETEARAFGWKSSDEWRGEKPPGYIDDPRKYTDRLENFKPFAKLKERLDRQEHDAQESARKMAAMNQRALDDQNRQHESRLSAITNAQRSAVEDADTERFDKLEQQRSYAVEQHQKQQAPEPPKVDPYVAEYEQSEPGKWLQNPVLRNTAFMMVQNDPVLLSMPPSDQVKAVEAKIKEVYPAYFPQPKAAPAPQRVDAGGLGTGITRSSAFSGLPGDAKAAFNRFVTEGLYENNDTDKKAFADEYDAA